MTASPHQPARDGSRHGHHGPDGIPRIEAYETETGTVIFDGENPLAWVHATHTVPIRAHA